jgi:hypothetical protein
VPTFTPGLELSRRLHDEVVRPAVGSRLPGLAYGAGLLGRGSEVLGLDDAMSTDHDWSPRVLLFVGEEDDGPAVERVLREELPASFHGRAPDLEVHSVRGWFEDELAIDLRGPISAADWLTMPEHVLATCVAGEVFHDEVGLRAARQRLSWYPHDVWLYLLVAGWWRVHPEANLVGRAGQAGDELGSSLLGARLATDLMRLCFLMERRYPPYPKWFGTAFARLDCGPALVPLLHDVVRAETWQARESALLEAYAVLARMHDALGVTAPVPVQVERMWGRQFRVLWGDFPGALAQEIRDPAVLAVAERWPLGPVDRFRELLSPPRNRARLRRALDAEG